MKTLVRIVNLTLMALFVIALAVNLYFGQRFILTAEILTGFGIWLTALGAAYLAADEDAMEFVSNLAVGANILVTVLIGAALAMTWDESPSGEITKRELIVLGIACLPLILNIVGLFWIRRDSPSNVSREQPASHWSMLYPAAPPSGQHSSDDASAIPGTSSEDLNSRVFRPLEDDYKEQEPSNYFSRHWRGLLSLPVAYWINGTVLVAALIGMMKSLDHYFRDYSLRTLASVALASLCLTLLLTIWSLVGIWRSANNHTSRGGKGAWAGIAQAMVLLGVLLTAIQFREIMWPQMQEFTLLALNKDDLSRIKTRISDDGESLILDGPFGSGSYEDVERTLAAAPGVRTVILNSDGGRIHEAERIAKLVRQRSLNTVVERHCASACTVVFLAGTDRTITPYAGLGFHRPSFTGIDDYLLDESTKELLSLYRDAGIGEEFLARVERTSSYNMWYPSSDELMKNKVINRVAARRDSSTLGEVQVVSRKTPRVVTLPSLAPPQRSKGTFAKQYRAVPIMELMEARFPGTIDQAASAAWARFEQNGGIIDVRDGVRSIISEKLPTLLSTADDATLEDFFQLTIDQMQAARTVSSEACSHWLASTLDVSKVMPQTLIDRERRWVERVVKSSPVRRDPPPPDLLDVAMRASYGTLSEEHMKVISDVPAFGSQPELQCTAVVTLYRSIAALPQRDRAFILQHLYTKKD